MGQVVVRRHPTAESSVEPARKASPVLKLRLNPPPGRAGVDTGRWITFCRALDNAAPVNVGYVHVETARLATSSIGRASWTLGTPDLDAAMGSAPPRRGKLAPMYLN